MIYGVWRSLVARSAGGREVAGSNPVTPIEKPLNSGGFKGFSFWVVVYIRRNRFLNAFVR